MIVIAWIVIVINMILCLISFPQVFSNTTISARIAAFISLMVFALNSTFALMVIF